MGYGWPSVGMTGWAAGHGDEPAEPPSTEPGTACGLVVAIGVARWPTRASQPSHAMAWTTSVTRYCRRSA